MRRYLLGLLLPLLFGCSGRNVVAGEEKSKAEQLAASLPYWCESTCSRLNDCAAQTPCDCNGDVCVCVGVDESCPTRCKDFMSAYTNAGDACAVVGERLEKCMERATCDDLAHDKCPLTDAERAACPEPRGDQEPTLVGQIDGYAGSANIGANPGSAYGGSGSYAGTGNVPVGGTMASAGSASTTPTSAPVTCVAAYGAGGGQPSDTDTSKVICEEGRDSCSDGHAYSWVCAADSQAHRACTCFVDSRVTGAFAPGPSCPLLFQVNAGCGWNVADQK